MHRTLLPVVALLLWAGALDARLLSTPIPTTTASLGFEYHDDSVRALHLKFFDHLVEQQVANIFKLVLRGAYEARQRHQKLEYTHDHPRHERPVVLDVGMNSGFYTMLSASLGARVYAFEPQVFCVGIVRDLIRTKNLHLAPLIEIHNMGLGTTGVVAVPKRSVCDGHFGTDGIPAVEDVEDLNEETVAIPIVDPQLLLPLWFRNVTLVKMDTEGAEADILKHLLPFVEAGRIHHIVVEIMPSQWINRASSLNAGLRTIKRLAALSKRVIALTDPRVITGGVPRADTEEIGGPTYEEFDLEGLIRDRHERGGACNVWFSFV
ncbi:hypothetical protein HYH03_015718 [Edaphochlamys debaryana]|uniref:Methyltransferase FkbM domain-containing protein n=1 Tax=Edaphochlamys debaryana TaxID=47281 RepID=A0A835XIX1_9CHLO|nr:hypothetical protein HYH03_015718 [Edaphochlamys debaryana]|eukprot:KAG2485552.1 hypothetical protein HYH03_015718 [Edaphochlamys debaryana]